MSLEIALLHTLLHLARRRSQCVPTTLDDLVERLAASSSPRDPKLIVRALRALARQGLVQRSPLGPRLTLAGLAVAVASKQKPRAKRLPGMATPLVRRRSAA